MDILETGQNFKSLSVKDLLDARDQYHWHLINKKNVVGTAVGLYLIRKSDPWPKAGKAGVEDDGRGKKPKGERRFDNSEVRPYSWPCILVIVREWVDENRFGTDKDEVHPEQIVPRTLYLPDGRTVPVCVVKAEPGLDGVPPLGRLHWPDTLVGGGFPMMVETQGVEHVASAGCLVTDGHRTFALTNRHVCGEQGEPVYTVLGGRKEKIGRASGKQLTRLPFTDVYTEYPGRRTYLNLDIGLIDLDDLKDWTAQVYGIGELGDMADLNELNISLRLVNAEVMAYGAASGRLDGRIKALFYRYKSVGGYDYVSDFLVAPEKRDENQTRAGDSGTVWSLVPAGDSKLPRPIAVEWGGQTFLAGKEQSTMNFTLATSLSNVCKLLDVELVQDYNTGVRPFWGATGHYSIAAFACELTASASLRKLMQANSDRTSFRLSEIDPKKMAEEVKRAKKDGTFVPLADVPDVIWKNTAADVEGGRDPYPRGGPEHPTHYADIDKARPKDNKTLRDLCLKDRSRVNVEFWQAYYDDLGNNASKERGLLPFRVWQFFDEMVRFASKGDVERFVCAAGILSHYVGDACMPLHGSYLADGYQEQTTEIEHEKSDGSGTRKVKVWPGKGVHSAYEANMVDNNSAKLLDMIAGCLDNLKRPKVISSGHEAAVATVELMARTSKKIPPTDLVDAYIKTGGGKSRKVTDALWSQFGKQTSEVMADGAAVLAMIWESAWAAGGGDTMKAGKLRAVDFDRLREIYCDTTFIPSLDLDHIKDKLVAQPSVKRQ